MGWSQESGGGGVTGVSRADDRGEEGLLTGVSWDRPGGVA